MRWIVSLAIAFLSTSALRGADWPAFRGPHGNGISPEISAPLRWSSDSNIRWKAKLPRAGNGSPIVSNGHVFLACSEDEKGLRRSLICMDRNTGDVKWVRTIGFGEEMPTHKTNPYCGSTPVADGRRVVVWHGSAGLHCYDFDGKRLWSRDLGRFQHMWGYGSSPILHNDRVILNCGPGKRNFVTSIDFKTGTTIWETDEPFEGTGDRNELGNYMGSWSTPVIAKIDGRDQIVCALPTRLNGYDPESGGIIWTCDGIRGPRGDLAYSSPMVKDDVCVMIGGFQGPGLGLRLGGTGNITATNRLWRNEKNPQNIGTGVFIGNHVYRSNAGRPGIVDCINATTGEVEWTGPPGGSSWSCVVGTNDFLYVTGQDGTTIVFRANATKFEEVAINELGEPSNSTPAISDGEIFIRTFDHLYCIANRNEPPRFNVHLRSREQADDGGELRTRLSTARWNPRRTAIIVCDMWDDHTCQGAAGRVAEMAPAVNRTIKAAREKGIFIIHAPSGTMPVYEDMPQRKRAAQSPFSKASARIRWNHWDPDREGQPFTEIAHGGCGCAKPCPFFVEDENGVRHWKGKQVPWTRQIESIEIGPDDAISDDGQEIFNMLEHQSIDNVILMGVHTNICVSGRPFGLRQMVYHGKNVVLCRDLTDALLQPRVPDMDQFRGTDLVIRHIESHICPTITSSSITGQAEFRFAGDKRE